LTASILDDVIQTAWNYGATDLNLIVADPTWARQIDNFNTSRVQVSNVDERYHAKVSVFEGSFGPLPVIMSRWMPSPSVMVLSTERVKVVPLRGRSFHYEEVAKTGDALKGMVIGEYTLEVRNEKGLAKAYA